MNGTPSLRKQYVLVVDANCYRGRELAWALADQGYYVAFAASGGEAIRYVAENEPDALVSDWDLPDMEGSELARQITLGRLKTKLILQKEDADWRSLRSALECGADEVLSHPCPVDVVVRVLERKGSQARGRAGSFQEIAAC